MIVLKRRKDEWIIIGDDISVAVKEVIGMEAIVYVSAPADMSVVHFPSVVHSSGRPHDQPEVKSDERIICPSLVSVQRSGCLKFGEETSVFVVECREDYVRLGIEAPQHTPIHRREVWELLKREFRDFES